MNGHKDSSGKFHPHGSYENTRYNVPETNGIITKSLMSKDDVDKLKNKKKSVWEAKLEEPARENGHHTHQFVLGDKATKHEVENALMRMHREDGTPMYYEQDVRAPYLHHIKEIGGTNIDTNNIRLDEEVIDSVEGIVEDWWMAISEHGLAEDIMNSSEVYPSTVLGYEEGDPIAWEEFTDHEKAKLIYRNGGMKMVN